MNRPSWNPEDPSCAKPQPRFALEDFPVYLDAGCGTSAANGLGNGYAQGPADMLLGKKANGEKTASRSPATRS